MIIKNKDKAFSKIIKDLSTNEKNVFLCSFGPEILLFIKFWKIYRFYFNFKSINKTLISSYLICTIQRFEPLLTANKFLETYI